MNTKAEKSTENKSGGVAKPTGQTERDVRPGSGFVDNRRASLVQRKTDSRSRSATVANIGVMSKAYGKTTLQRHKKGEAIGATFDEIPAGTLAADWDGKKLSKGFTMKATFNPDETNAGGWGEYRQYIKGEYLYDDTVHEHDLGDGAKLKKDEWQEDGPGRYGHRDEPGTMSKYIDDPDGGSSFEGEDEPEWGDADPGERMRMLLDFKGQLIDTKDDSVLKESLWKVEGDETRPE